MDIAIRPVAATCAVSGRPLAPGDRVWSVLARRPDGMLERIDVHADHQAALIAPGPVLCRWSQRVRAPAESAAAARRAALQSAEEVFLSLFDEPENGAAQGPAAEARDRLKFFLALQLERKRLLKPIGPRRYRHAPTGREFTVPDFPITP